MGVLRAGALRAGQVMRVASKMTQALIARLEGTSLRLLLICHFLSYEDKVRKPLLDTKSPILNFPASRLGKTCSSYVQITQCLEFCYSSMALICSCHYMQLSIKYC